MKSNSLAFSHPKRKIESVVFTDFLLTLCTRVQAPLFFEDLGRLQFFVGAVRATERPEPPSGSGLLIPSSISPTSGAVG